MSAALVAVLAGAAVSLVVAVPRARGAFPGTNGKLLFTQTDSAGVDLFVSNADGSGVTQLTTTGNATGGKFSPDGTKIAFRGCDAGASTNCGVRVMNADGSNGALVMAGGLDPAWSPNATQIVYSVRDTNGNSALHIMDANGSNDHAVGSTLSSQTHPVWSTANKIAFTGPVDSASHQATVWQINPDGTGQSELATNGLNADWKPDGSALFYNLGENGGIECVPAGGGTSTQISPSFTFDPISSPDGAKVAFSDLNPSASIAVANADGSGEQKLGFRVQDVSDWQAISPTPTQPASGCASSGGGTSTTSGGSGGTTTTAPAGTTTTAPGASTTTTAATGATTTTTTGGTGATTTTIPPGTTTTTTSAPGTTTTTTPSAATTTTTTRPTTQSNGTSSPATALPGQPVTLSGGGFQPNVTLTINGCSPPHSFGTATSDSSGNFSVQVTIPRDAVPGNCQIVVSGADPNGGTHQVNITVTIPSGPSSQSQGQTSTSAASPGQPVTVSGGGFAPNRPVGITADNPSTSLGTTTSDASGNVSKQVTIPANATPGPENIAIVGPDPSGGTHQAVASLTVTGSCGSGTTTQGQLALTINPSTVQAGQVTPVQLTATGFGPDQCVALTVFSDPISLGTATADGNGTVTTTVQIPASLPVGTHQIVVSGPAPNGQSVAAVGMLSVVATPVLASTPAQAVTATPSFTG